MKKIFNKKIKTIKSIFEIHGFFIGMLYILRLVRMLSDVKDVYCLKVDSTTYKLPDKLRNILARAERSSSIQVEILQLDKIDDILAISEMHPDMNPTFIKETIENGHLIFITRGNQTIASFSIIGLKNINVFGKEIMIPEDTAYLYKSYVRPEYRSKGHYFKLLEAKINYLKQLGIPNVFCIVYKDNKQPLSNLAKMNFIICSRFIYLRLWYFRFYFNKKFDSKVDRQNEMIPLLYFKKSRHLNFKNKFGNMNISQVKFLLRPLQIFIEKVITFNKDLYLKLFIINKPYEGGNLKIAFICKDKPDRAILNKVLIDNYNISEVYNFFRKRLRQVFNALSRNVDLIIIDGRQDFMHRKLNSIPGIVFMPKWIIQKNNSFSSIDELKENRSVFWDIKRSQNYGYYYEYTKSDAMLTFFYQNMYLPYINNRYKEEKLIRSFGSIKNSFRKGGLLLLKQGDKYLAGAVISLNNRIFEPKVIGVLNGDVNLVKNRVLSSLQYFYFEFAKKKNFKVVNLGLSRAFLNDGVLKYKAKWNTRIEFDKKSSTVLAFKICKLTKDVKSFLINNPFITIVGDRLIGNVYLDTDNMINEEEIIKKYKFEGIDEIKITKLKREPFNQSVEVGSNN